MSCGVTLFKNIHPAILSTALCRPISSMYTRGWSCWRFKAAGAAATQSERAKCPASRSQSARARVTSQHGGRSADAGRRSGSAARSRGRWRELVWLQRHDRARGVRPWKRQRGSRDWPRPGQGRKLRLRLAGRRGGQRASQGEVLTKRHAMLALRPPFTTAVSASMLPVA